MQKIWKAMAGVLGKFKQALQGRPLLTNCLTYGMLYGGAEFSQQTFIRKYSVRYFLLILKRRNCRFLSTSRNLFYYRNIIDNNLREKSNDWYKDIFGLGSPFCHYIMFRIKATRTKSNFRVKLRNSV